MPVDALAGAITAARTSADAVKAALAVARNLNKAEITGQLIDAQTATLELLDRLLVANEEKLALRARIEELERAADISGKLIREGNAYYLIEGEERKGPFCLACWDSDQKLVNMKVWKGHKGQNFDCGICSARIHGRG